MPQKCDWEIVVLRSVASTVSAEVPAAVDDRACRRVASSGGIVRDFVRPADYTGINFPDVAVVSIAASSKRLGVIPSREEAE